MTQGDLFALPVLRPTCGACVHRNAKPDAPQGYCTPEGWRQRDDSPCAHWFGREELAKATYGRKAA